MFYRMVTAQAINSLGSAITDTLLPIQLGVGVEGGVETATHFINAILTDDELKFAGIGADQSNAFNSRERATMLAAMYNSPSTSPIWRLADWSYTSETPLWVRSRNGEVSYYLISSSGARQGCGIGSLLYALSMKDIYTKTTNSVPGIHTVAIADDFTILGPPSLVLKAYENFVTECKRDCSIKLNPKKKFFYYFHKDPLNVQLHKTLESLNFNVLHKVAKILGTPIGIDNTAVENIAVQIIQKYTRLFTRLQHSAMPEVSADQILRRCGVHCMTYLTRTVAPSRIRKAAKIFDSWITKAYLTKHEFQADSLSPSMYAQLSIPLSHGGMGLRKHEDTCIYAFFGAAARAAQRFNTTISQANINVINLSPSSPYATHLTSTLSAISLKHHPSSQSPIPSPP